MMGNNNLHVQDSCVYLTNMIFHLEQAFRNTVFGSAKWQSSWWWHKSLNISNRKVTGYLLKDQISIPGRRRNPPLRHSVQNRTRAHTASFSVDTQTLRLEEKWPEGEAYPSPSTTDTSLWIFEAVCPRYHTWCSTHSVTLPSEAVPDLRCFGLTLTRTYGINTCISRSRHPTSISQIYDWYSASGIRALSALLVYFLVPTFRRRPLARNGSSAVSHTVVAILIVWNLRLLILWIFIVIL
jgi:hypothetical protein